MTQQVQISVSQTIKLIKQPKGSPSSLKLEERMKKYYIAEFLKDISIYSKKDLDSNYSIKLFQDLANNKAMFLLKLIKYVRLPAQYRSGAAIT